LTHPIVARIAKIGAMLSVVPVKIIFAGSMEKKLLYVPGAVNMGQWEKKRFRA